VVIVTHDARVAAYAERVVMVRDGLLTLGDLPSSPSQGRHGAPASAAAAAAARGTN